MTVLDASALLALIHDEPGGDIVAAEIGNGVLGTANLAEVIGKRVEAELDVNRLRKLLAPTDVGIEPQIGVDAEHAGARRT